MQKQPRLLWEVQCKILQHWQLTIKYVITIKNKIRNSEVTTLKTSQWSVYLWHGVYTGTGLCPGCSWQLPLWRWHQCHCSCSGCSPLGLRIEDHTSQLNSLHSDDLLLQLYTDTDLLPGGEKHGGRWKGEKRLVRRCEGSGVEKGNKRICSC